MRFFFSVKPVRKIASKKNPQGAQPGEYDHEGKADLPEQLKRLITVIPYCHMEPFIDNDSCDEFHRRHKYNASEDLPPQRVLPMDRLPLNREEYHADSAEYKHGPMGETAEEYFKKVIDTSAKCPQK